MRITSWLVAALRLRLRRMDPGERGIELLPHLCERQRQCSAPTDQHIIMTVAHLAFGREPDHLPQSPPHSIALYRVADLPRHRKTDPCHTVVAARSRLQHESTGGRPLAPRRSAEVGAAGQPIHRLRMGVRARSRAQPLAPVRPARCQHFATAFGRHAGAKAVAALAHQFARLIGPFHGMVSAFAIGAAYTGALSVRQTPHARP